ncbi:MAG: FecR domain-containing protein [Deltaproteobacteria bacterium]|nr:FecR domain-containing protein [Deltaproteobacteria bacterium]
MRKIGVFCVIVTAIFGLCIVSSYAGDKPGDQLTEVFKKDVKPEVSLVPALTIHRDEKTAYILKKGNQLYTYDTLISEEQSKAQAKLNDGSIISIGPYTKLVFDKSVYDPSKPARNSLLSLLFGKARFIVTKLVNFRDSRFNVKTPTAVAGVRGSDFALCVAPGSPLTTTIMTGEGTTVTFAGNTGPTRLVGPMSASSATQGMAAAAPLPISSYLTTPFISGALSKVPYWYYIAGGVAAGGTVVLLNDSGSDSDPGSPVVTSFTPEGTTFPGGTGTLSFGFSKDMIPATEPNFVITSAGSVWNVTGGSVAWLNSRSVQVGVTGPTSAAPPFTMTLSGFTDTVGIPLSGQNSFDYN